MERGSIIQNPAESRGSNEYPLRQNHQKRCSCFVVAESNKSQGIYGTAFCYNLKESIINNLFVNKRKAMNFDVFFNTAQIGTALTIIAFALVLMLRKRSHKK
jgi:hypothetical protein